MIEAVVPPADVPALIERAVAVFARITDGKGRLILHSETVRAIHGKGL